MVIRESYNRIEQKGVELNRWTIRRRVRSISFEEEMSRPEEGVEIPAGRIREACAAMRFMSRGSEQREGRCFRGALKLALRVGFGGGGISKSYANQHVEDTL